MLTPPPPIQSLNDLVEDYCHSDDFNELSDASQRVYKGCLHAFLRPYRLYVPHDFTHAELSETLVLMQDIYTEGRCRQMKAAYRRFAEWLAREHRLLLPPLARRRPGRPTTAPKLPVAVMEAVYLILCGPSARDLTQTAFLQLRWEDLNMETDFNGKPVVILLPSNKTNVFLRIPTQSCEGRAFRTLAEFASTGDEQPTGPVLPATKGSDKPLPLRKLRAAMRDMRLLHTTIEDEREADPNGKDETKDAVVEPSDTKPLDFAAIPAQEGAESAKGAEV